MLVVRRGWQPSSAAVAGLLLPGCCGTSASGKLQPGLQLPCDSHGECAVPHPTRWAPRTTREWQWVGPLARGSLQADSSRVPPRPWRPAPTPASLRPQPRPVLATRACAAVGPWPHTPLPARAHQPSMATVTRSRWCCPPARCGCRGAGVPPERRPCDPTHRHAPPSPCTRRSFPRLHTTNAPPPPPAGQALSLVQGAADAPIRRKQVDRDDVYQVGGGGGAGGWARGCP